MGRKIKKSVAVFLIATMLMSIFVIAPYAAETGSDKSIVNNNDYSLKGNNSVGNLIADGIADHQSNQISSDGEYLVTELEVNENIATVSYTAKDNCTILVAIYDENNGEMLASGKTEVSAGESKADVKIETENMPEYFVAKAFILNESNAPLSNPYCSEMYTTEIQELKKMTVDDFESGEVLNFDDDNTTNFGVYSNDVKKVVSNENTNIIQLADEENIKYVFANADESLKTLKPGDIFTCGDDSYNPIILKIGTISVDGDTVTIDGEETSLEEVFEYVKIEGHNDTENAEIDESTMSGGVTYSGKTPAPVGAIGVDTTAKQKIEFDILTGKRIDDDDDDENGGSAEFSAKAGIYAEAALEIYISMSRQVFDFKLTVETSYSISLAASYKHEIEFATLKIPVISKVITVDFTPGAYFEAEAALEIDFTASVVVGFGYSDKGGFYNNCQKPHADCELNLEGDLEFGLSLKLAVVVGKKWIGQAGLEGKVGFEMSGAPTESAKIKGVTVKHSCNKCFSGDLNFAITITPFVEVFKDDILQDVFDTELEISIHTGEDPMANWYYSIDKKKGGFGNCPYMDYIIPVKVIKNGSSLSNVSVMEYESLNKCLGQTDVDGRMEMCLPGTKTGLYLISVDNAYVSFAIKDDDVQVLENGKWSSISKAENFKDNYYIINVPLDPPPTEPETTEPESTEPQTTEPVPTEPQTTEPDNDNIEWTFDNGILYIEGTGSMDNYTYQNYTIDNPLYKYRGKTTKIVISNEITKIGDYVFADFTNIESISIPESVTSIGQDAFLNCSNLANITIPESVTSIGIGAFCKCINLTSIIIPDNVTSIGESAFNNCSNLANITLPDSITSIGERAFLDCSSLANMIIPDNVTSIGDNAFNSCSNLVNIIIPDSVTSIGEGAFYNCKKLTKITMSDNIKQINDDTFRGCSNLANITIPDSITNIGNFAFSDCTNLANITIPDSVTSIGKGAFYGCTNLVSITIPDRVTSIGNGTFYGCTNLVSITIPDSVTSIGTRAFYECKKLINIEIPKVVTDIGSYAFYNCENINGTIPDTIKNIGEYAFYNCKSLKTKITISDSIKQINDYAFYGCASLESIEFADGVKYIGDYAFSNCSSICSVVFPGSLSKIMERSFSGCTNLKYIRFEGETVVCLDAFKNVTATAYWPKKSLWFYYHKRSDYGGNITWIAYDDSNQSVSASYIAKTITSAFSQSTKENVGLLTINAEYDNKVANAYYIIAVVKDKNAEDVLSADNLLYIDQIIANENGSISKSIPISDNTDSYEMIVYGPEKTALKGDVSGDGKIGIDDVTYIQKHLASTEEFTSQQEALADVNDDGEINIDDATLIQKYLAGLAVIE